MAGRKRHRLELTVDTDLEAVIRALTKRLAGGESTRNFRSEAARQLMSAGASAFPGLEREAARIARELRATEGRESDSQPSE